VNKYKTKEGIELNYTQRNNVHTDSIKEVIREAIRLCNRSHYDKYSAARVLDTVKEFLKVNFDIEEKI
jgi:hypothetical protein